MKRGSQAVTITQIAKLAGTSASTVSRVLNQDPRISRDTRDRVLKEVEKHRYKPNMFAQVLKGGRTGQIGVLSTNIGGDFFGGVLQGIDDATRARGIHMLCTFAHGTGDFLAIAADMLTGGRVDGVIFIDPPMELFDQPVPPGAAPAALCAGRPMKRTSPWYGMASATLDNRDAMGQLVRHLVGAGCRDLVHLAGPANTYDGQVRRAAFQAVTRRHASVHAAVLEGHLIDSDGIRSAWQFLRREKGLPDAILCFNDSTARGVVQTLEASGVEWRGRVAITGWDDTVTASLMGLTSVAMPTQDLGHKAAELLLRHLASGDADGPPRHEVLPGALCFRTSTEMRRSHG